MAERILFPEWRAQNDPTKYPFAEAATLRNEQGRVFLEGTFLDAIVYPIGGKDKMYITQVVITFQNVTIYIGTIDQPELCSGTFSLISPDDNVELFDAYQRPAGLLVSESIRLSVFQSWGAGTHTFNEEQTELAATVCIPTPEVGVRGVLLEDGTLFTGDIWLVGDDGVVFRTEDLEFDSTCQPIHASQIKAIRMDIVGDPLFRRRLCEPQSLFETPRFIRTIRVIGPNGEFECEPDEYGNLQLLANNDEANDTVLRITPTPSGIRIGAVGSSLT